MVTETADAEIDKWYVKRSNPEEELLFSTWKRHHDLLLKFAMILCLGDGGPMVIQHKHVTQAKNMVAKAFQSSEKLVVAASETMETKPSNEVAKYIRKRRQVLHTPLSRYFRSMRGMNSQALKRAINDLVSDGLVRVGRGEKGGLVYTWEGVD